MEKSEMHEKHWCVNCGEERTCGPHDCIQPEIIATWSPCCRILREGKRLPNVMHTRQCRQKTPDGELGPTIFLVDARELKMVDLSLDLGDREA